MTAQRHRPDAVQAAPVPLSTLEVSEPAIPEAIGRLRHRACNFAAEHGAVDQLLDDIGLAVSEAVTNAVKYAYEPASQGRVRLAGSAGDGWLELIVSDRGRGFCEGESGGLGLGLSIIAKMATELTIEQATAGTEIKMRFTLGGH